LGTNKEVTVFNKIADPVGKVRNIDAIEQKVLAYKKIWDSMKSSKTLWAGKNSSKITNFIMIALDDMISTAALLTESIPGPDKKATVINAVERLYDYTVLETLPVYLLPFSPIIKKYVIQVLVSNSIDWIVLKYKDGNWKLEKPVGAVKPWSGKYLGCKFKKGGGK
jgi:hypothetical protein